MYDPTHGYEPYWADGDWVFMEKAPKPNATTTVQPTLVCGDDCPYIYWKVQHVCARSTYPLRYGGCDHYCYGNWIDDFTRDFHTFDTYCEFLNEQCRSPEWDRWTFLHSGKCISRVSAYLKPLSEGQQILERATVYFTQMNEARANHSLPPINYVP